MGFEIILLRHPKRGALGGKKEFNPLKGNGGVRKECLGGWGRGKSFGTRRYWGHGTSLEVFSRQDPSLSRCCPYEWIFDLLTWGGKCIEVRKKGNACGVRVQRRGTLALREMPSVPKKTFSHGRERLLMEKGEGDLETKKRVTADFFPLLKKSS